MSMQDKISKFGLIRKRKLFDHRVALSGTEALVIRLRLKQTPGLAGEMFDTVNRVYEVINSHQVPMVIQLPEDLPMHRMRKIPLVGDITPVMEPADADAASLFLYEVLPILGWAAFSADVENGDLVTFKVDTDDDVPYLMVLQVSYVFANVDQSNMVSKKMNLAPYTMQLEPDVVVALTTYRDSF